MTTKKRGRDTRLLRAAVFFAAALLLAVSQPAPARTFPSGDPADEVMDKIGVDEKLGAQVPAGLMFTDQDGSRVRLGDYFDRMPVILTLNFYECPMLCPLTFRSLADTMANTGGLTLGRDYRVVTVSFNPEETQKLAREKADETHAMLKDVPGPDEAWPFLIGDAPEIDELTAAVGYRYVKVGGSFAHPAAVVVLSPGGKISRYLYGIEQEPMDFRLALIEATDGEVGGSRALNRVLMYCYDYDPEGKRYSLVAINVMKAAGTVTLVFLAGLIVLLLMRERAKQKNPPE